ncbi:hypothetical protein C2845_PM02G24600 [Panicum miliaceum]|uniref:Uncharacterized protein n=1 Tax=Panicum miliaceum TaxID=4540 RepID=A0A3L6S3L0_PANMI|nr:hypothetical protein C2845_PM02G24600 [Panicum miliaceum]
MYRRLLLCCVQEKLYSNKITVAGQEMVKEHVDQVPLEPADTDVAFLVVSDPFE